MSKQATEKRPRNLKAVDGGHGTGGEKKPRAPKASGGNDFLSAARALASKHRGKLNKHIATEQKLERALATVRAQREAAEAPLREVERVIAANPPLPGLEAGAAVNGEIVDADPMGVADEVNQ